MHAGYSSLKLLAVRSRRLNILKLLPCLTLTAFLVTFLTAFFCAHALADLNIMPVEEIKVDMTGYGKTVFRGTKIEKFPVKVLGVMPGAGLSGEPLILIELTGPEVERYGGVAQGMSGSPVYIEDKLIGAVSLTFPMTDHSLAGVTPIQAMMQTFEYEDKRSFAPFESTVELGGREYAGVQYSGETDRTDVLVAQPVMAPVMVKGLSERTIGLVDNFFRQGGLDVRPVQSLNSGLVADVNATGPGSELEPGSSIAVQLVRGDIDFSAVGTLTAVDNGRGLLFGHTFFRKGPVNYLLADAPVLAIVSGDDMPFKMTNTGILRGQVVQDRGSALVAELDRYPELVPVVVDAVDLDIGRETRTSVKVVSDPDIIANLVVMVILQALDNTIDRIGEGTAKLTFTLDITGHDSKIVRENLFYDGYDISAVALSELVYALLILDENRYVDAEISSLKVRAEIDSTGSAAAIESVRLSERKGSPTAKEAAEAEVSAAPAGGKAGSMQEGDQQGEETPEDLSEKIEELDIDAPLPVVYPGDRLALTVSIRPYKSDVVEEKIYIKVPYNIGTGRATIDVFSGMEDLPGLSPTGLFLDVMDEEPDFREHQEEDFFGDEDGSESLDDLLNDFMDRDMNNELVAIIEPIGLSMHDYDDEDEAENVVDEEVDDSVEGSAKKKTQWVLTGSASMKVRVKNRESDDFKNKKIKKSMISTLRQE